MKITMKLFLVLFFVLGFNSPASGEEPSYRDLGPLRGLVVENEKNAPYVVFLHGWGGDGQSVYDDLKSLLKRSEKFKKVNWIFPDAPKEGWFQIEAIDSNTSEPLYDVWQQTLKPTRKKLEKMITAMKLDPKKIIWGGFSQGGITAIDYVLHSSEAPLGLIVDSGIYYKPSDLKNDIPHLKGIRFQMAHDPKDEMLPFEKAQEAVATLKQYKMVGELQKVKGHQVHPKFIESAVGHLTTNVKSSKVSLDCKRSFSRVGLLGKKR